mgnify:CR=1 FL=1
MPTSEEATRLLQLSRDAYDRGDALLHLQAEVSRLTGQPSSWAVSYTHLTLPTICSV